MKSKVYNIKKKKKKKKVDTPDELLARIFDVATRIKKREDQFRLTTPDLRTRVGKVHCG